MSDISLKIKDFSGDEIEVYPKLDLVYAPDFMGKKQYNIGIRLEYYEGGARLPYANFTVNLGEFIGMKNCAYIDTNNCWFAEDILKAGIATDIGLKKQSGFCMYPLWQFSEEFLRNVDEMQYEKYSTEYDKYMGHSHSTKEIPSDEKVEDFVDDLDTFFRETSDEYDFMYEDVMAKQKDLVACINDGKFEDIRQQIIGMLDEYYLDDDEVSPYLARLDKIEKSYLEAEKPSIKKKLESYKAEINKSTPTTQHIKKEMEI